MTAQHASKNLFFYVTPGSSQGTYVVGNDLTSSATGNPAIITHDGAPLAAGTPTIMVVPTARITISLCVSAAVTFIIRLRHGAGFDTLVNGGTALVPEVRYVFEDLWTPQMYNTTTGTLGISFRFGGNCTVRYFAATWQAV